MRRPGEEAGGQGGWGRKETTQLKAPSCAKGTRWTEVEFPALKKHEQTSVARVWRGGGRWKRELEAHQGSWVSHTKSSGDEVPKMSMQKPLGSEQASTGGKWSVELARKSKVRECC